MAIIYAAFEVQLHGLNIQAIDELETLRSRIQKLLDDNLTKQDGRTHELSRDVVVDLLESAGAPERCAEEP